MRVIDHPRLGLIVTIVLAGVGFFLVATQADRTGVVIAVGLWGIAGIVAILSIGPWIRRQLHGNRQHQPVAMSAPSVLDPPTRAAHLATTGSLTMVKATPHSRVHLVRFDTSVIPGQRVPLTFRATAVRLASPVPFDAGNMIRAIDPLPAEVRFDKGRLIVHGFADDGIDVEMGPSDRVFSVELEVFE